jgi:dethiobiotin synthetase
MYLWTKNNAEISEMGKSQAIFVTATDTDVGKTFFSKSLIHYFLENRIFDKSQIAYYKPIQCGIPTDFDEINDQTGVDVFCTYNLKYPASPDYSSSLEEIEISIEKIKTDFIKLQAQYRYLIVEGAGGPAVPINKKEFVSDLIKELDLETVLVTRPDLGTINHSILSIEYLKAKGIKIKGLYVSAKSRDLSEAYNVSAQDKLKQNTAAINSVLEFTKIKKLDLMGLIN